MSMPFEIIHRDIVLSARVPGDGKRFPVTGNVARLADGRLRARYFFTMCDGDRAAAVSPWSEGDGTAQQLCSAPCDWRARIRSLVRDTAQWATLNPVPEDSEIESFRRAWPKISDHIGLSPTLPPFRFFSAGRITVTTAAPPAMFPQERWWEFIDRHCGGDFGDYGTYDEVPVTDETIWTIAEQPVSIQNSAAISSGAGTVISQYMLPDADQPKFVRPEFAPYRAMALQIVTVLGRGPETMMHIIAVGPPASFNPLRKPQ
jgi:hypothetical protein